MYHHIRSATHNGLEAGDTLSRRKGPATHVGIYLGTGWLGQPQVFHSTPERGPHISSLEDFLQGNPLLNVEKPQPMQRAGILARVHDELRNPAPHDLLSNNCQHVVNRVVNGESFSEGVRFAGLILAMMGLVMTMVMRK